MKDQVVVIIGGTSGMGLATARLACQLGARVIITGRSRSGINEVLQQLPGATGETLELASESEVNDLFEKIPSVDHVFVAAGATKLAGLLDGPLRDQLLPIELRLYGSLYLIRAAARKMRPGGSMIFTGGLSTDRPVPGAWISGVGTASVEQLARVMALELAPLRFNAISPGWTDTPMWDAVLGENKQAVLSDVEAKIPIKRMIRSEEIAEAVLFLMRNEAITGEVLHIDGGARLV